MWVCRTDHGLTPHRKLLAVPLTKVKKKDREWKSAIIDKVRNYCDQYNCIYVFKYYNMRNDRFKELREVRYSTPLDVCCYNNTRSKRVQTTQTLA